MTEDRFLKPENSDVFTFGRPPVCIDILTQVKGLDFDTAFGGASWIEISDTLSVRVLSLQDLITAKKSAGRPKDLDDLEQLSID